MTHMPPVQHVEASPPHLPAPAPTPKPAPIHEMHVPNRPQPHPVHQDMLAMHNERPHAAPPKPHVEKHEEHAQHHDKRDDHEHHS